MVERRPDGALYPYVMDFGLAREVTAAGQTMGGVIEGTPAFMSPEQARGELQGLDRRTDVYSLGATLYDLLAGEPPFAGETGAQILLTVLLDEPPPLRQRVRTIPVELETVVMKCLEKEPERRYDSAKALADDLGHYLAGEPIAAQKQSLRYRGWKFLRRHKVLAATIAVALGCLLAVSGLLVRARVQAAAEARLAQQLGQEVKEIELFLRLSYTMPLHDVSREVTRTRVRMATLARRLPGLRPAEAALGHYALGRGHLALHEYTEARRQLDAALSLGDQAPEVHAALGQVLGEQYRRLLTDAQRTGDKTWLQRRKAELERQYLAPARAHLSQGHEAPLESAAYAEGLLAFYSQHYEEALRKTTEAAEQAPWLYEVNKLAGDIHTAIAEAHKSRGEYEPARAAFVRAAAAYTAARDFARSDASVYEAEAEMCIWQMELEKSQGLDVTQSFHCAIAACDKARIAAPDLPGYLEKKVWAYFQLTDSQQMAGKDPRPTAQIIMKEVQSQSRAENSSALLNNSVGGIFLMEAAYEQSHGIDYVHSTAAAEKYFRATLRVDPQFSWAWTGLALTTGMAALRSGLHGQDYLYAVPLIIEYSEKAYVTENSDNIALIDLIYMISWLIELNLENGLSPIPLIAMVESETHKIPGLNRNEYQLIINLASCKLATAKYAVFLGNAESASLQATHQQIDFAYKLQPNNPEASRTRAAAYRVGALAAALRGADPSPQITLGLAAAQRSIELSPGEAATHQLVAQLYLQAADWQARRKLTAAPQLKQARVAAERALTLDKLAADSYVRLAEVAWREAREEKAATPVIAQGLAHVDQALALNPRLGRAFAARAALLAEKARTTANPAERAAAERAAREALQQALTLNRFLQRECTELAQTLGVATAGKATASPATSARPD